MSDCDTTVCVGCLVEVQEGPLRVSEDPHNFGIVSALTIVSGCLYADIVTNTGHHRLITPDRLCVLSPPGKYSSDQDTCDC